ncbi:hypothetical protein GGF37_001913 [Kickxella alabastrina]|nr:hypothetical protein GGF37_001913 [Kickxella alabastrina]
MANDCIEELVSGFGDTGQRLYRAIDGKMTGTLPLDLQTHSMLISGRSGIGKSLLVSSLAKHFECRVIKIHISRVLASGNQHTGLKQMLANIPSDTPVVVWLVDIELFRGLFGRVVEGFLKQLVRMPRCLAIMTTRSPDKVPAPLRFACDDYIRLLAPASIADRLQLCRWFAGNNAAPQVIEDIAARTHGKIASEIFAIIAAHTRVKQRQQQTATSSVADTPLQTLAGSVHWSDIGGLDDIIDDLKESIVWPLLYRDQFRRLGIKPPRGVLLHGPPGTGKTMMAKAAATEVSANFIAVAIPDLIKGEVGESEKALAAVFESAKRSPSIVFLDEIEAIFGSRDQAGEVGKKLISQLFLEMDNIPEDTSVVILAATNAPHLMDESILRAGRLDKMIHVPRPGYASRLDILKRATRNLAVEDADTFFPWLAELEMSGAELKGLIRAACYAAIQRGSKTLDRSDFECAVAATTTDNDFIST